MHQDQAISLYRPMLHSIAYKIVGCMDDAEDIVQDTLLKWLTIDKSKIENTKSYLIKAVVNNCLNHLERIKKFRKELFDQVNPTELIERSKELEIFKFDFENELSEALEVIHKKLEPIEKAVFILREGFNYEYDELQLILEKKKENCRQLLSRAKSKLEEGKVKFSINPLTHNRALEVLKSAWESGKSSDLINHLLNEIGYAPTKKN
ncbi:MAG: sigma-70 family RNA polymerase sigma factor [Cyclobacteriaceae bacterium]